MAATITEAASAASDVAGLLEHEPEPLTAAEAEAIVADLFRRAAQDPPPIATARPCRCRHRRIFEAGHCGACGHDLEAVAA